MEEIGIGEFARRSWAHQPGTEDERLARKPEAPGLRTTYLATGPVTETDVPENYRDFAVPFA